MTGQEAPLPRPLGPRTVVVRACFDDPTDAMAVYQQLTERGYATEHVTSASGQVLLTVTTPAILRAEVNGLIWLRRGREMQD